jgi:H+/Cl- antiporter ClcA/CBS domain-containing protein
MQSNSVPVSSGDRGAGHVAGASALGDFSTNGRVLLLCGMAVVIGVISAFVAKALIWLIAAITNLAFHHRWGAAGPGVPQGHHLGWTVVLVPVIGALIIGLMARYGSEKIRGHGIPEALEAILLGRSRMEPKVALLKPLSAAISIGTGGPFGAEGPIIMTGGAFGSIFAQQFHLSSAERKTLLVAGAAAGMSAVFGSPVAALLLAVELLLFEWKPRSFIPVAVAAIVASILRVPLLGAGPIFSVVPHAVPSGFEMLAAAGLGVLAGFASGALTGIVYACEDLFQKLPIHWMWWPAIGALFIGIGGWYDPRVLGVGYDTIHSMLRGELIGAALAGLLITKAIIWSVALGSGTSGGVLAPLLIMGGALGALAGHYIPQGDSGMWALIGMAAMMGGTMRSPLTAMVFAVEVTHDYNLFPALFIGSVAALGVTVLLMKRSILTEKLARRGHHITREYSIDPFELVRVRDVMDDLVPMVPAKLTLAEFATRLNEDPDLSRRQGTVVVDEQGRLTGMITRGDLFRAMRESEPARRTVAEACSTNVVVAYPEDSLHAAVMKMLDRGVGRLPVVEPENPDRVVGYLGRAEVLAARSRLLEEEHVREASGPVWGWGVGRRRLKQS